MDSDEGNPGTGKGGPPEAQRACRARQGRDPASIQVVALGVSADREELEALEKAGADAAVVRLTTLPEKESLAELEEIARKVFA